MSRKQLTLVGMPVTVVPLFLMVLTFTPTLEFEPQRKESPVGTVAPSPAQVVADFLGRSGPLPPPGTDLVLRQGVLDWDKVETSDRPITDVRIQRVRLVSGAALLPSVLDDDPTYQAEVKVEVATQDGKRTALTVNLWDYGLLMPWSITPLGDGWKPGSVRWR